MSYFYNALQCQEIPTGVVVTKKKQVVILDVCRIFTNMLFVISIYMEVM